MSTMTDQEITDNARGMVLSWIGEWALMLRADQSPDEQGLDGHDRVVDRTIAALLDIRRALAESWGWLPPPAPFPFPGLEQEPDASGGAQEALRAAVVALGEALLWIGNGPAGAVRRRWREAHAAAVDALTEEDRSDELLPEQCDDCETTGYNCPLHADWPNTEENRTDGR